MKLFALFCLRAGKTPGGSMIQRPHYRWSHTWGHWVLVRSDPRDTRCLPAVWQTREQQQRFLARYYLAGNNGAGDSHA